MSEEISKQYEKGLVDLMSIVEPLIDKFKADKNSIDIQQLQLVTEYLITDRELDENYIDELEVKLDKQKLNSFNLSEQLNKEKEKNKELFEEYNKRVATIIKYEQEIKEIIDKIDAEDYYCLNEAEEDLRKLVE